ncbi:MAG: SCP2 sterol-binding domain-containing protein [candidate division KSB1 bacterium]|nr:SCP2 sterol-binding domain-containing protein [candidate division KSB1 bacterium]
MGKAFASPEELCDILGTVFRRSLQETELGKKLLKLNKSLRFVFHEPNAEITVRVDGAHWDVICGPCETRAEIQFWMSGDAAHRLWLGKVKPLAAIMARQIRAAGPIRAMAEIEALFALSTSIYKQVLKERGREDLLR